MGTPRPRVCHSSSCGPDHHLGASFLLGGALGEAQVFSLTVGPELSVHSFLPCQPGCVLALASMLPLLGHVPGMQLCAFVPCDMSSVCLHRMAVGLMWSLEILPGDEV